jgi:Ni,Fe-hydrogenase III small subunit
MMLRLLNKLVIRSPWIYRLNAGSCNGCDVEMATAALIPRYDVERLGCKYCGSPRHADIVLISGPLTQRVRDKVLRVFDEIPNPKVTVGVGVCPVSGGVFRDGYASRIVDSYIPLDVVVPGCPPRPQAIMDGILKAREAWSKMLEEETCSRF